MPTCGSSWPRPATKIAPNQIGERGQLQEWLEDWDFKQGTDQRNRHISPLYGLYPGEDISWYDDKKLVDGVKVLLLTAATMPRAGASAGG